MQTVQRFHCNDALKFELMRLYKKNNWRWLLGWSGDIIVIASAVALTQWSLYAYPLSVLIIGSRQRALASLVHEAAHLTLTQSRSLSYAIGHYLTGLPIFQDYEAYRHSHVHLHHHHLGDADKDPDYRYYIDSGLQATVDRFDFMFNHLLKTVLLLNIFSYLRYLVIHRLGALFKSPRKALTLIAVHAVLFSLFYATTGLYGYLMFWLVPYLTAFQVIGWLSEVSEHFGLFGKEREALRITRNRFPSWWERLFIGMHGDNLHLTHHLFAGIPYWNLYKAHCILLQDASYAAVNQVKGGIISGRRDRQSVIRQILNIYRLQNKRHSQHNTAHQARYEQSTREGTQATTGDNR
ncbi:fatty acid desaturase family protein [Pseudomonas syringae]|nr:fatty acid desaturase family protein [Pseudomonas syringae]